MGTLNLTVQVLDISPKVTLSDLNIFFSYCGTVDNIQLCRKNDQTQLAFVTFKQPYAFQTALLLNGAVIGDSPIRILALQNLAIHPIPDKRNCKTQNKEKQGIFPVVNSAIQGIASKSMEMFNKTADELEENCKLSEKGRALMHQTRLAICAAEKGAGQLGTAIMNNEYVSNGSIWLSGVTPVDRDGNGNPEWNHQLQFDLRDISLADSANYYVKFSLRCEGIVFGNKTIGEVCVPLKELIDEFNRAVRFVSYQVRTTDGKPNGVLNFSYKLNIKGSDLPAVEAPEDEHLPYPSVEVEEFHAPKKDSCYPSVDVSTLPAITLQYLLHVKHCSHNIRYLLLSSSSSFIFSFSLYLIYIVVTYKVGGEHEERGFSGVETDHCTADFHCENKIHGGQEQNKCLEVSHTDVLILEDPSRMYQVVERAEDDDDNGINNDDDGKYPDLTHCLFEEEEVDMRGGSIIDMVKNGKEEGEEFRLEDEIDHVADLFITRFHKQMRMQKLESFKRYQEMLQRGV
ncbi:unnamed protein product, partial [Vitis vinifera]